MVRSVGEAVPLPRHGRQRCRANTANEDAGLGVPTGAGQARLTPRNLRAAATRERIVQATAAAFDTRGYRGVSLKEVIESLGLTTGALHYFFPTKEDLAVEIVHRHFGAWEPLTRESIEGRDNLIDGLVELSYRVADAFQNDVVVRAGARLSAERNLIPAELPRPYVGWHDRLTNLLGEAADRQQIRGGLDLRATAEVIVSFFFGAQAIVRTLDDPPGLRRQLDQFWRLVLPSLLPSDPTTEP